MSARQSIIPIAIILVLAGCATTPTADDRTGGIAINVLSRHDDGKLARYDLGTDGILQFAGGANAEEAVYSWEGPLTDAEIARLDGLVSGWEWEAEPRRLGRRIIAPFEVTLTRSSEQIRFEARSDHERVPQIAALLAEASNRRLDPYLQKLPKPSIETALDEP